MLITLGFVYGISLIINIIEIKCIQNTDVPAKSWILLAILTAGMPFLWALLIVVIIYRFIVQIILRIKHGQDFYGLVDGGDAFHTIGNYPKYVTIGYHMVRSEGLTPEEFYNSYRERLLNLTKVPKFNTRLYKAYGYSYLLKQKLSQEECVIKMKKIECASKIISKEQFSKLMDYYYNLSMPKNGKALWQLIVGTQPISWRNDKYHYFPVIVRIHHVIGDGISLLQVLSKITSDETNCKCVQPSRVWLEIIEVLKTLLLNILFAPASLLFLHSFKANDVNALRREKLAYESVTAVSTDVNVGYVCKIKKIKKRFPEVPFPMVAMAAFSASLANYFKQKSLSDTKHITVAIPVTLQSPWDQYILSENIRLDNLKIKNNYTLLLMRIPINMENQKGSGTPVIDRLRFIMREVKLLKNPVDYYTSYFFMHSICSLTPELLSGFLLSFINPTAIVSILPAPINKPIYNGKMVIEDIIAWTPHLHNIGVSVCMVTFKDNLHMGLSVDKSLIPNQSDVQKISDDVYKYLDMLEEEVNNYELTDK